jgi:hypothetical protein
VNQAPEGGKEGGGEGGEHSEESGAGEEHTVEGCDEEEQNPGRGVVDGAIDEGAKTPEVLRQYERRKKMMNVHWKKTPQMMRMMRNMMTTCQGIGRITISHGLLSVLVRMCLGSIGRMRFP